MRLSRLFGLVTASALLFGANAASALTLQIDDLNLGASPEATLVDGGTGLINYNSVTDGAIGAFSVVVSTGIGAPILGGPNEAEIDLSVQAASGGAGALQVTLTDTGLSLANLGAFSLNATALSSFSINANSQGTSATVESFIRVGASTVFEALSTLTGDGEINLVESITGTLTAGVQFDLRTVITMVYDGPGFATADANLSVAPVPLPAAFPLLLAALMGFGFVGRRRRQVA